MAPESKDKKKLLILAGADVHSKIVTAAKELGYYTIVTDNLEPQYAPAKLIADEYWMINIMDTESIINRCREENIDGILSFCIDPAQIPYQKIAENLSLPCYGTKEQFQIFTNKTLFKEFCRKQGVHVVPEYDLEDIYKGEVKFPVLVKPSVSRGSRGQSVCYNLQEVIEGIERARHESKDDNYLIERYMEGAQDMSFSYVLIDGEPFLLKIGDRYLGKKEDNLDRQHISTVLPSRKTREYVENVEPKVKNMLKALGMKFGAIFLQGFWENGDIFFYDPALRFPGGDFDIALKKATGYDNMKTFVNFAMTGETSKTFGNPSEAYKLKGNKALILSIACRPGIIKGITGLEPIINSPYILSSSFRYQEGDEIPDTGDIRQRVAEFVFLIPEDKIIKDFVDSIYHGLSIIDNNNSEMIISKPKINE